MKMQPAPDSITIGDCSVPLVVRHNRQAKRITLRLQPATGEVILSIPKRASLKSGMAFLQQKSDWLSQQLSALPKRVVFEPGAVIPLLGVPHCIYHLCSPGTPVMQEEGRLLVSGDPSFLSRRLQDWLRHRAREECGKRARSKALQLGRNVQAVSIRNMRSRWGSCTEAGRLTFNWRLIFAPEAVLDYVVAHEVAHLEEMHHGAAFWELAASLCDELENSRQWLKEHGHTLHCYG